MQYGVSTTPWTRRITNDADTPIAIVDADGQVVASLAYVGGDEKKISCLLMGAPDLLEALTAAHDDMTDAGALWEHEAGSEPDKDQCYLCAAIRKATGDEHAPAKTAARLYPVPCPDCRDKPLARAKCRRCGGTGTIRVTVPEE